MRIPFLYTALFAAFIGFFSCLSNAHAINLVIINNNGPVAGPFRLVSSLPGNWQTVTAPTSVTLVFSQPPRADRSSIKLFNSFGDPIETGEIEIAGNNMSVPVSGLTEGKYTAKWRTHCACDDINELSDSLRFTVK